MQYFFNPKPWLQMYMAILYFIVCIGHYLMHARHFCHISIICLLKDCCIFTAFTFSIHLTLLFVHSRFTKLCTPNLLNMLACIFHARTYVLVYSNFYIEPRFILKQTPTLKIVLKNVWLFQCLTSCMNGIKDLGVILPFTNGFNPYLYRVSTN